MIKRPQDQKQAQKKLQAVKRQLYGTPDSSQKLVASSQGDPKTRSDSKIAFSFKATSVSTPRYQIPDTNYLKRDLIKISLLSTIAIGTQVLLYVGLNRGLFLF